MTQWHWDLHKRKKTGGKHRTYRGKRAYERGNPPSETHIGERKIKIKRARGGGLKVALLSVNETNVLDPKTNKVKKAEIKNVLENPANRDYQKRSIITKGATILTSLGKAKVTSRPGQDGVVNAILSESTDPK